MPVLTTLKELLASLDRLQPTVELLQKLIERFCLKPTEATVAKD